MNTANVYEELYANMKNRFTVVNDNSEYTLGEYMLMKAGQKKASKLPVAKNSSAVAEKPITAFFKYVNDKLALKAPPAKDKTIRRFPFRTSCAAVLSAVIACTLAISYGSATLRNGGSVTPPSLEVVDETPSEAISESFVVEN